MPGTNAVEQFMEWLQAGQPNMAESKLAAPIIQAGANISGLEGLSKITSLPEGMPESMAPPSTQITPEALAMESTIDPYSAGIRAWQESRGPLSLLPKPEAPILPDELLSTPTPTSLADVLGPSENVPAPRGTSTLPTPLTPPPAPPGYLAGEKGMPREILQTRPAPAEEKYEYEVPKYQPGMEDYEKMAGVKPEGYFREALEARMKAFPQTTAAALQTVGRRPEEFQLAQKSVGIRALEAFLGGLAGVDTVGVRDKETMRLRQIEMQELEFAMKKFGHEDQMRVAQWQMEREDDRVKRDQMGQAAAFKMQNLPSDYGMNPKNAERDARLMQDIMGGLGVAWRLPQKYVQAQLDKSWNPSTGQYEGLVLGAVQKWKLENMAKADIMEQMFPGYPKNVYYNATVFGKWPEWADDTGKLLDKEIAANITSNPEKSQYYMDMKNKIGKYQQMYTINNFSENLSKMVKGMNLDPKVAEALMVDYIAKVMGGETGLAKEVIKGQAKVAAAAAEAAGKEGAGFKAKEVGDRMDVENKMRLYPLSFMGPINWAQYGLKDVYNLEEQKATVDTAILNMQSGKGSPQDAALVQKWMQGQWKIISHYLPATANALRGTGQAPSDDPAGMQALFEKATYKALNPGAGIDDLGMAKEIATKRYNAMTKEPLAKGH